eukprot:2796488-Amphidinium_carterae.1
MDCMMEMTKRSFGTNKEEASIYQDDCIYKHFVLCDTYTCTSLPFLSARVHCFQNGKCISSGSHALMIRIFDTEPYSRALDARHLSKVRGKLPLLSTWYSFDIMKQKRKFVFWSPKKTRR